MQNARGKVQEEGINGKMIVYDSLRARCDAQRQGPLFRGKITVQGHARDVRVSFKGRRKGKGKRTGAMYKGKARCKGRGKGQGTKCKARGKVHGPGINGKLQGQWARCTSKWQGPRCKGKEQEQIQGARGTGKW